MKEIHIGALSIVFIFITLNSFIWLNCGTPQRMCLAGPANTAEECAGLE